MKDQISTNLAKFISKEILKQPDRDLDLQEPLISSGLIDSFSLVDMSLFIENEYGVRIADTELNQETFDTLEELAALISTRM